MADLLAGTSLGICIGWILVVAGWAWWHWFGADQFAAGQRAYHRWRWLRRAKRSPEAARLRAEVEAQAGRLGEQLLPAFLVLGVTLAQVASALDRLPQ
jgi:uncharacterized membrane protein YphA (DoxX/SURF4 family)